MKNMSSMSRRFHVAFVLWLLMVTAVSAAEEIVIRSFDRNGVITWDGALLNSTCRIEWASSLTRPGLTNWQCLTNIVVQNPTMSADVPMFYRVVGIPAPLVSEGLIAYYPFTGNSDDQSGNAHHGTTHGTALATDRLGNTNAAYLFDGTAAYVEVPDDTQFHLQQLSLCVWLRPNTGLITDREYVIVSKDDWMKGFQLVLLGPDSIYFGVGNGSGWVDLYARHILQLGSWQHLAATYDGSNLSLFVNGALAVATPCAGTIVYGSNPLAIGKNGWNATDYFDGVLDEIRVYSRALSSNEVPQISVAKWSNALPLPAPKADLTVATCNGMIYAFGGYDQTATDSRGETYQYDPTVNLWTRKADMPTPRWGPIAVEFGEKVYVFGGARNGYEGVDKNEVYDPTNDTWQTKTNIPADLAQQGLMGVRYGTKIHLFYSNKHYEYDPATDSYFSRSVMPTPRTWGTCGVVSNKIYVIGGYSYSDPVGATDVNEVYDPATDTWTAKAPLPVKKYGVTRENPVIDGRIYVTHGLNGGFHVDNYVYDPVSDSWQQKASAVHPRDGVGCCVLNGRLHVLGGRADYAGPYGLTYHEVYDPNTDNP